MAPPKVGGPVRPNTSNMPTCLHGVPLVVATDFHSCLLISYHTQIHGYLIYSNFVCGFFSYMYSTIFAMLFEHIMTLSPLIICVTVK